MSEQSNKPIEVSLSAGQTYYWCSCGKSTDQPFCDGSHKDTGMEPLSYHAEKDETVWLCNCKQTNTAPFCDGAHNNI